MATIDRRVLRLIEALSATDADWIAFEIIDALRAGRIQEETAEDLLLAQQHVRSGELEKWWLGDFTVPSPSIERLKGTEQIDWVANYISERVTELVAMLGRTLSHLDFILSSDVHDGVQQQAAPSPMSGIRLVFQGDLEQEWSIERKDISKAETFLPDLLEALRKWAEIERKQGDAQ